MNSRRVPRAVAVLSVLALVAAASAQTTWIVDMDNRPGAHFTGIQAAVNAASTGDEIFVRTPALQSDYLTATIDGKGLWVHGDAANPPNLCGLLLVRNLAGSDTARFSDLMINTQSTISACSVNVVRVSNCQGLVIVERVRQVEAFASAGFHITDCSLVVFDHSMLHVNTGNLTIERSTVMFESCDVRNIHSGGPGAPPPQGPGIQARDHVQLYFANTTVAGVDESVWTSGSVGPAIQACGDVDVYLSGGTVLIGGQQLNGTRRFVIVGNNVCFPIDTRIHRDPSVQLVGPYPDLMVTDIPGPVPGLSFTLSPTSLQIDQHTHPGSLFLLARSQLQPTPWATIAGPVFLDPLQLHTVSLSVSTGTLVSRTVALPPSIPPGTRLSLQGFELLPNGTALHTNAAHVSLP